MMSCWRREELKQTRKGFLALLPRHTKDGGRSLNGSELQLRYYFKQHMLLEQCACGLYGGCYKVYD